MSSVVVGVCGLVFVAMGVFGLAASYLSERRRATMKAMGTSRLRVGLVTAVGALLAIGGFASEPWLLSVSLAAFVACGMAARRHLRTVDDPPAYVRRQLDRSMNPLVHLRHPVREVKATLASMNLKRNLEGQREWEQRHDISHRGDDGGGRAITRRRAALRCPL